MFTYDQTQLTAGKNRLYFPCNGYQLAADLYMPEAASGDRVPAIIFARPATQVKEQASAVYGRKMAARGYALLAVDHIGFGESEGPVRNYEHTDNVLSALTDGISVLRMLDGIDSEHIYGMGLCMGGAYITRLAFLETRMRAIVAVSAYFDNADAFAGMMDEQARQQMTAAAAHARETYMKSGDVLRYDILGGLTPGNVPQEVPKYYADAVDYYLTDRGGCSHAPNYSNMVPQFQFPVDPALNHSAFAHALTVPKLFIRGSQAATTGPLTDAFYPKAAEPKELFVVDGAEHFDLYDIDAYVDQAVEKSDQFFSRHKSSGTA